MLGIPERWHQLKTGNKQKNSWFMVVKGLFSYECRTSEYRCSTRQQLYQSITKKRTHTRVCVCPEDFKVISKVVWTEQTDPTNKYRCSSGRGGATICVRDDTNYPKILDISHQNICCTYVCVCSYLHVDVHMQQLQLLSTNRMCFSKLKQKIKKVHTFNLFWVIHFLYTHMWFSIGNLDTSHFFQRLLIFSLSMSLQQLEYSQKL